MSKEKQLYEILRSLQRGEIGTDLAHLQILRLFDVSGSLLDDKWKQYRNITNNEDAWCFKEWLKSNDR